MDYRIAIVGSEDSIVGFKAIGVEPFAVSDKASLISTVEKLCDITAEVKYAIVLVTEDYFEIAKEELFELSKRPLPAILSIPSHEGSKGFGKEKIKRIVEQAVGSDILGNKGE